MYNVIEYLENSGKLFPDKIAVIEEDKKITYKELINFSKIVGTYFASEKVFNEPIMIFMDKGIDTLISFFGVVYAGCYYSLLNPELPESRITQIKDTLKAKYVITNDEYMDIAKSYFKDVIILNIKDLKLGKIDEKSILLNRKDHIDYDPLYVNFTSGSTGVPKGVVISHRSVIDFIDKFTVILQ